MAEVENLLHLLRLMLMPTGNIRPFLLILEAKSHSLSILAYAEAGAATDELLLAVEGPHPAIHLDLAGGAASYWVVRR